MQLKDIKSLAEEYSISIFTIRRFVKMGLPHYRLGKKILIKPEDFEEWFERFKVAPQSKQNKLADIVEGALAEVE